MGKRNLLPGAPFIFLITIFNMSEMELQHHMEKHDNSNNFTIQLRPFYFTYSFAQIVIISAVFAGHFHWLCHKKNRSCLTLCLYQVMMHLGSLESTQEAPQSVETSHTWLFKLRSFRLSQQQVFLEMSTLTRTFILASVLPDQ